MSSAHATLALEWDGLLCHRTERGKQDVFPAAAKDGFTAVRSVTKESIQIHGLTTLCAAQWLYGVPNCD